MSNPNARPRWRKKAVLGLVAIASLVAMMEGAMQLAGVKPLRLTRDPFAALEPAEPLFLRDGERMKTNPAKTALFNTQSFAAEKQPGTYRIFVLGDSTAFGYPYDDRVAPGGWLRSILMEADPDRDWEVINCGGLSYASYRVCELAQELVQFEPDLFVVFAGHSEFLEGRSYPEPPPQTNRVSAAFDALVVRTRLGSAVASWWSSRAGSEEASRVQLGAEPVSILDNGLGPPEWPRDDLQCRQVVAHFRHSLDRTCAIARSAGARVVLVKPAANLRGFAPFRSAHADVGPAERARWQETIEKARKARAGGKPEEAVVHYVAAAELDPRYAQGLWEAGDALFAAKRYSEAKDYFVRAVDEDACPLRATSAIQAATEEVGARHGVPVIDFPRLLETAVPGPEEPRIPGNECFLDHAHPTLEGNQLLGWALFGELAAWKVAAFPPDQEEAVRRVAEKVLSRISPRDHALAQVQVIRLLIWAGRIEEALHLAERTERLAPGLAEVHGLRGRIFEVKGRPDEAMTAYRAAFRCDQDDWFSLSRLAILSFQRNRFEDARAYFATAILCMPPSAPLALYVDLRMGLGMAFAKLKQWKEAALEFQTVLRLAPEVTDAKKMLAAAEAELAKSAASPANPSKGIPAEKQNPPEAK